MPWMPEEQIQAARAMSAIEYLKTHEAGRLKKSSARHEWELTDHDSFKINEVTSAWHWKSRDIGGYNALDFLVKVDGMGFVEAVEFLSGQNPSYIPPLHVQEETVPFELPAKAPNCGRIRKYLLKRGISNPVITYCIQQGLLYESLPYHNAVFVGYDEKQEARYAFLRGIHETGGRTFKMEQRGSDKRCSFCIPPKGSAVRVAVYEAAVDALAHMTLENNRADKYRLSLGGISAPKEGKIHKTFKKPAALETFLEKHPEVTEMELCTDNDFAGRWAAGQLRKAYEGKYRIIENLPDIEGADYGDMTAMEWDKHRQRKKTEKER